MTGGRGSGAGSAGVRGRAAPGIIPGEPARRIEEHLAGVLQKRHQVVAGIEGSELAAMDQTHEDVAHPRPVLGLVVPPRYPRLAALIRNRAIIVLYNLR